MCKQSISIEDVLRVMRSESEITSTAMATPVIEQSFLRQCSRTLKRASMFERDKMRRGRLQSSSYDRRGHFIDFVFFNENRVYNLQKFSAFLVLAAAPAPLGGEVCRWGGALP